MNISPEIMNEISDFSKNSTYEIRCGNCVSRSNLYSTHFGIKSIANIAAKIWNKIPNEIKEASCVPDFKSNIKKWVPHGCPCRFRKTCERSGFYIINLLIFDRNPSIKSL